VLAAIIGVPVSRLPTSSLSGFRGGPTFPAMFLGAVGGVALSHLPGLPLVYGVAMGIAAMTVVMVVAYVLSVRLTPSAAPAQEAPAAPTPDEEFITLVRSRAG
jgi:hypothetical protein